MVEIKPLIKSLNENNLKKSPWRVVGFVVNGYKYHY